jgi:hypothetical protein
MAAPGREDGLWPAPAPAAILRSLVEDTVVHLARADVRMDEMDVPTLG